MNFFENITLRGTRTRSTRSTSETSSDTEPQNATLDGSTNGFPNLSGDDSSDSQEIKQQIEILRLELSAIHQEVAQLRKENKDLKYIVSKLTNHDTDANTAKNSSIEVETLNEIPSQRCGQNNK